MKTNQTPILKTTPSPLLYQLLLFSGKNLSSILFPPPSLLGRFRKLKQLQTTMQPHFDHTCNAWYPNLTKKLNYKQQKVTQNKWITFV